MRKRPVTTFELIPVLKMIAPYKVEVYDTRHGPEVVMYDGSRVVKRLRVTEDLADLIAEARGILTLLPGFDQFTGKTQ